MENAATQATEQEKPRKKKSAVRSIINFLIYLAIIMGIVVGLPRGLSWALDTNFPMAAITSGSMWPNLKKGDLVFIKGVHGKEDISVGDIIVYENSDNKTLTIHRVIEMRETELVTKGDANFTNDNPTSYESVIGKTLTIAGKPARIPQMGNITVYASGFVNK